MTRLERMNPVLQLPAARAIAALPAEQRSPLVALLYELGRDADERAQRCWTGRKAVMAAYWKAVGVYARHIARTFER